MDAKELLIHHSRKWQSAERFDARFIDVFGVLVFALEFKREIVCQMATFMVAAQ